MNIEDEKSKFIGLLTEAYKASISKHDGHESVFMVGALEADPRRVYISGNTLERFDFDYRDMSGFFWDVLCPALKADGYLLEYQAYSPTSESFFLSSVREYTSLVERRDHLAGRLPREYWSLASHIASGRAFVPGRGFREPQEAEQRILDEIADIGGKIEQIKREYHGKLTHEFVVNPNGFIPEKERAKHVVLEHTPDGANWRSVQMRFLDNRTLHISLPREGWNRSIATAELGLEKKGNERPKKQWELLEVAAGNQGRLTLPTDMKGKESKRRQINELNRLLKAVFPNIAGEPFEPQGGNAYQATFEVPKTEESEEF